MLSDLSIFKPNDETFRSNYIFLTKNYEVCFFLIITNFSDQKKKFDLHFNILQLLLEKGWRPLPRQLGKL